MIHTTTLIPRPRTNLNADWKRIYIMNLISFSFQLWTRNRIVPSLTHTMADCSTDACRRCTIRRTSAQNTLVWYRCQAAIYQLVQVISNLLTAWWHTRIDNYFHGRNSVVRQAPGAIISILPSLMRYHRIVNQSYPIINLNT